MKKRIVRCLFVLGVAVVLTLLVLIFKSPLPKPILPPQPDNSAVFINPSELGHRTCHNIWEYWTFIMRYDLPDDFITWEQVSMLGKVQDVTFSGFVNSDACAVAYRYIDANGATMIFSAEYDGFISWTEEKQGFQIVEPQRSDMTSMRAIAPTQADGYSVVVGRNFIYKYLSKSGNLYYIQWTDNGATIKLNESSPGTDEKNTLFYRLTSIDHDEADVAFREIKARLALGKVISILINLVLMVIPVGAISTVIILIYEKKKKKAAAIAPPAEEVVE